MHFFQTLIAAVDTRLNSSSDVQITLPVILLGLLILGVIALAFLGWVAIGVAKFNRWPLPLLKEQYDSPPWGGIDLLIVGMLWFSLQLIGGTMMRRSGLISPETTSANASLTVMSLGQLLSILSIAVASFWLLTWFRSRSQYCGWSTRRLLYDILLGLSVFVLTAPMLWILMKVSTDVTKINYNHPLMQAIQREPTNILAAIWVAVIAAPIFEEFGFRVLLQGYLQSLADKSSLPKLKIALLGRGRLESLQPPTVIESSVATLPVNFNNEPISNPYMPPRSATMRSEIPMQKSSIQDSESTAKAWPVLVSGLLFGLAHFEYGVSWIPLVFFGFVLGWLYQKTNRIWPSLVAHMFCNFIGVAGITVQALYGAPPS